MDYENMNADIKRSSKDFSFIDIIQNAVTNNRFLNGYKQLKQGKQSEETYLWLALSAIGQDAGETIYQNVLNYIDLASNIDLCKINALRSMVDMYGIHYQILDKIKNIPIEIENMIDVLSINKKYLANSNIIDSNLVAEIMLNANESKDAELSDYVNVEYRTTANSFLVGINDYNLAKGSGNMPDPENMLGKYQLFSENGYNAQYVSDDRQNDFSQFGIDVYREYINWNSVSVDATDDEYNISTYFTIKKFRFEKDSLSASNYAIYLDSVKENFNDYQTIRVQKLSCVMYAYLGNIEMQLNRKTGNTVFLKTPFDYRYNFEDYINRYNSENIDPWSPEQAGFATQIMEDNKNIPLFLSAYPEININYKNTYIDTDKYAQWLVRRFTEQLSSMCNLGYIFNGEERRIPIYENIRNELADENYKFLTTNDLSSNARVQKLLNNIELTFNEKAIADNIENGKDFLFNYSGVKKELISAEIASRSSPSISAYNDYTTRTAYYRENKVRQYFQFIENFFQNTEDILAFETNYELDWNMLKQTHKTKKKMITTTPNSPIDIQMIIQVAQTLANITLYIASLREQLKSYAQKNYMKGTFNLLSYVINEYLCQYPKTSQIFTDLNYISQTRLSVDSNILKNSQFQLSGIVYELSNIVASAEISSNPGTYAISVLPTNGCIENNIVDLNEYKQNFNSNISSFQNIEDDFNQIVEQLEAIKSQLSTHTYDDIGIIEYDDVTEYFNIKTDTTSKSNIYTNLNNQFWNTDTNTNTNTQFAFTDKAIDEFYKNILNMSSDIDDLDDFLSTLYNVGASKSYIGKDYKLHIDKQDDTPDSEVQAQVQMYLKFSGQDIAYIPYYNNKNMVHSSYQIHPYLYNFIKTANLISPIENGFNGVYAQQAIADNVTSQLNANIGKNGEIINVWKNASFDFTGYMSKYEYSAHQSEYNAEKTYSVVDYEGIFYPPAIEDFLQSDEHTKFAIQTIEYPAALSNCQMSAYLQTIPENLSNDTKFWNDLTFYHKYYNHLKLSNIDRNKVVAQLTQLSANAIIDNVKNTVSLKQLYVMNADANATEDDLCYDIYKYGTDKYGNNYILLKKYGNNADYEEKQNTPGQLFIRLKNHPIAVPAFGSTYQAIKFDNINGELSNILYSNTDNLKYELKLDKFIEKPYFYDMEFDQSKRTLLLNAWPINNAKFWNIVDPDSKITSINKAPTSRYVEQNFSNVKRLECSQIIICNIDQQVDVLTNETRLLLTHDTVNNYDSIFQVNGINVIGKNRDKILSFIGYMKTVKSVCPTYVIKTVDVEKPIIEIEDSTLSVVQVQYTWHADDGIKILLGTADFNSMPAFSKCTYFDSDIKMSYFNNVLTFATLANMPHRDMLTYFGKISGKTQPEVILSDDASQVDTSIDLIDQYIAMFDMKIDGDNISAASDAQLYNVVVDASYIPLYSGAAGRLDISKSNAFMQQNYQTIELLGCSSDIDNVIAQVNPSADFSYEYDDLTAAISGRIFEDYPDGSITPDEALQTLNDTIHILHNKNNIQIKLLNVAKDKNGEEWSYWSMDLPFSVNDDDIANAKKSTFIFFNSHTTAKNMYYVGNLSSIFNHQSPGANETVEESFLKEQDAYPVNYNANAEIHEKCVNLDEADVTVTGTYNTFNQKVNMTDNNNIVNVNQMKIAILTGEEHLKFVIYFKRNDKDTPSFVSAQTFKFVIYNPHMLKLYEVFHMLDEAGVYYCSDKTNEYKLKKYDPYTAEEISSIDVPKLQDLDFSKYDYLSAIPGLSGYVQNLSFKLDEEMVFNVGHQYFYFPGYNDNFPTFIMNIVQSNASTIDNSKIFDKGQCFVFTMEDKNEVANSIGKIDIAINKYNSYCLRVYEDYDRTKYPENDAQNVEYVKFSTDDNFSKYTYNTGKNSSGFEGLDVDKVQINPGSDIDFALDEYEDYGLLHTTTEGLETDFSTYSVQVDINSSNLDLEDLLDIYVNYKIETNGAITLYFNYFNYINTPYIKIENGKLKMDTVDGTYLKLESGRSGILDIVAQFNIYCNGTELIGTKKAILKSYNIYNVSDDKPKFLIKRIRSIEKNSLQNQLGQLETYVIVHDKSITLDDSDTDGNEQIRFMQEIYVQSTKTIKPGMTFQLFFNPLQLQYDGSQKIADYLDIDTSGVDDGILTVTVREYLTVEKFEIPFNTTLARNQIAYGEVLTYDIDIDDDVTGTTIDNRKIDPITSSGSVIFGYKVIQQKL